MSLFPTLDISRVEEKRETGDRAFGERFAFLFTATEKGNSTDVHFMMSMEDAKKWCSLDCSRGVIHGTRWAYFFTSVRNFFECHWGGHATDTLDKWHDNGRWDAKIAEAGLRKIGWAEACKMLTEAGYIGRKEGRA